MHYDIAATRLAPLGARVFHRARMREPLGRHDGVASAKRAHGDQVLLDAASRATGMRVFLFEPIRHTNPFCASMRPVVGMRPELVEEAQRALGRRARGLVGADGVREDAGGGRQGAGGIRKKAGGASKAAGVVREGAGGAPKAAGDVQEGAGDVRKAAGGVRDGRDDGPEGVGR
ncbi:hypothetical protein [Actinoallomurus sp. NPDC050550]|uniref:hypothetical protein n=1 Tax=Actinoallomurus sp. NPDC050550 TaxID=3154937 RepID=UPI0033E071E9